MLSILEKDLNTFRTVCERERCPFAVVGTATGDGHLKVRDDLFSSNPVGSSLNVLLGKPPKTTHSDETVRSSEKAFNVRNVDVTEVAYRVLRLSTVAAKSFLVTIGDHSVSDVTHHDQMVSRYQTPVTDCTVTMIGLNTYRGEAMSMGERPTVALFDAPAPGRICVGEAITNIAAVNIGDIDNIRPSANWMATCGNEGKDEKLYRTVKVVFQACQASGLSIPAGRDSLPMKIVQQDGEEKKSVVSPLSLVISAFASVKDMRKTATPELKNIEDSVLLSVDLGFGKARMGGSAFGQVHNNISGDTPDLDDTDCLRVFYSAIRQLVAKDGLLAYHDRSDDGLSAALTEMAFAGRCGLNVDLTSLVVNQADVNEASIRALFNEELDVVIQIIKQDVVTAEALLKAAALLLHTVTTIGSDKKIVIRDQAGIVLEQNRTGLRRAWQETSHAAQRLRDNPTCVGNEFALIDDNGRSALFAGMKSGVNEDIATPSINSGVKPKIVILREQGVDGQTEIAAAFTRAGFDAYDVHMLDLMAGRVHLADLKVLAACGGFSYGGVLGTGESWAKSILSHPVLRNRSAAFFADPDTLALSVCDGCQVVSNLAEIISGTVGQSKFKRNLSEQFEARLNAARVPKSAFLILSEIQGSSLPVAVSHGEGRADFALHGGKISYGLGIALQYVDGQNQVTQTYPLNPDGSLQGIVGVTSAGGHVTIIMPHPEHMYRAARMS